ncbi:MAG: mechanosensitive ion channel family protein [Gammaproteobacteria bacterium]|nr:mechanosensitive ion channel family protein [Gammaproteobacteria bacterium]
MAGNDSTSTDPQAVEAPEKAAALMDKPWELADQLPTFIEVLPAAWQPYWLLIQRYPIIEAILIVSAFWALAFLIRRYIISLVQRVTDRTKSELDDVILDEVRGPVFSTVFWFGVIVAAHSSGFSTGVFRYVVPLVLSIIIFSWLRAILVLSGVIFRTMSRDNNRFKRIDMRTEPLLIIGSKIIILLIGCYALLIVWGINPVGLLASAGIVGIAFGFAAKDTLANLFSGVFILADQPYKLGDYVNLESGERGKVTHIGIRSTRLLTRDDIEVTIPNGVIGNGKVVNESGGPYRKMRVRLSVQCAYDADLEEVHDVLMEVARGHEDVCAYPAPRVRVRGFGDSGIDIQLLCWINDPEDRGRMTHILYMAIHQAFADHNLEIPFPKRDVNFYPRDASGSGSADAPADSSN